MITPELHELWAKQEIGESVIKQEEFNIIQFFWLLYIWLSAYMPLNFKNSGHEEYAEEALYLYWLR